MQKIFAAIFTLLASSAFAISADLPETLVPEINNRDIGAYNWRERHALILKRNKKVKPDYVFIGDSITHHWGGEPSFRSPRGTDSWDKLFAGFKVTNLGYGFDYVDNAYYRAENGELDGISPRVILVNIGTNNIGHRRDSAEVCAANTRAFLALLRKKMPRAKILLLGVYPRREKKFSEEIRRNNRALEKMADGKNIFYAEPGRVLLSADGVTADPALLRDVVHPNAEGYRRLGEEIAKALARIDPKYKRK